MAPNNRSRSCSSSSSSSSSCSSSCTSSCPPSCNVKCCPTLCAAEICCRFSPAVVRVHGQAILTTIDPQVGAPAFDWSPTATANQAAVYETHGNGFLIKGKCIVCPASLVSIPPDALYQSGTAIYRYPYVSTDGSDRAGNGTPNAITKVSQVFVDIFDVNGKGHAYTYEATVCGIDGAGNTAVLALDLDNSVWNSFLPCIEKCHPYFRWSRSRKSKCGDPVFLLGGYSYYEHANRVLSWSDNLVQQGILTDNKSLDYTGWIQHEIIRTTLESSFCSIGSPILNNCGAVIGMQVATDTTVVPTEEDPGHGKGFVIGVSEFFMRQALKTFLQGVKKCQYRKHLGTITDAAGNYSYYIKGYMGLAWTNVTGADFTYFVSATGVHVPLIDADGNLVDVKCTENVGLRVVTVAQATAPQTFNIANPTDPTDQVNQNPTFASLPYFDSQTPADYPPAYNPDTGTGDVNGSPFAGQIFPNDIVYALSRCRTKSGKLKKKCKLGDLYHQVAPGLFTWRTMPGDTIYVQTRDYTQYWAAFNLLQGSMATFPLIEDWPWYNRRCWGEVGAPLPVSTTGDLPFVGFRAAF